EWPAAPAAMVLLMRVVTALASVRYSTRSDGVALSGVLAAGRAGSTAARLPARPRRKTRPNTNRGSSRVMHTTPDVQQGYTITVLPLRPATVVRGRQSAPSAASGKGWRW